MMIGDKIKKLREANNMTQGELAALINTDGNTVSRWERNKLGIGSSYVAKLAKILHTTTDYLLNETDEPENEAEQYTLQNIKSDSPAKERSIFEKSRGTLMYRFKDGEELELPDTERGYALFEKIFNQKIAQLAI